MYSSFDMAIWDHATQLLLRVAVPVILRLRSAVGYGLQASASASADPGDQFRVGVCHLNSRFFSCMNSYYPSLTVLVFALCPLVLLWIMSRRRQR